MLGLMSIESLGQKLIWTSSPVLIGHERSGRVWNYQY